MDRHWMEMEGRKEGRKDRAVLSRRGRGTIIFSPLPLCFAFLPTFHNTCTFSPKILHFFRASVAFLIVVVLLLFFFAFYNLKARAFMIDGYD